AVIPARAKRWAMAPPSASPAPMMSATSFAIASSSRSRHQHDRLAAAADAAGAVVKRGFGQAHALASPVGARPDPDPALGSRARQMQRNVDIGKSVTAEHRRVALQRYGLSVIRDSKCVGERAHER